MGILNKIFGSREKQPSFPFISSYAFNVPPERGMLEYLKAYGEIGWLYAVISKIATAVSDAKWRIYRGDERGQRAHMADHPAIKLLDYANPFQTGQEFMELTQLYLDLVGEAFWVLNFNRLSQPAEMWIAPPQRIKIIPSRREFIKGYIYANGEETIPLNVNQVIHFKLPNPSNPYRGIGPVQALAIDLDAEEYAGKWNRNFFFNSARPDLVLKFDGTLSDEAFERIKAQWASQHQGVNRAHRVGILESGGDIKQVTFSQKDMDFSNLRKLNRENLLGAFGMPLSVMGISENVNKANAEAGEHTFARWIVKPRLNRIKNKLNEQYLPKFKGAEGLEIDFDEVVPQTGEEKRTLAESGCKAGYMTINEARQLVGLDPLAARAGDVLLVPMNLIATPTTGRGQGNPEPDSGPEAEAPQGAFLMPALKRGYFQTEEQKELYWKTYANRTEVEERLVIHALDELWAEQRQEALDTLKTTTDASEPLFDDRKAKEKFTKRLQPLLTDTYRRAAEEARDLIEPEPAHSGKAEDYMLTALAMEWIASRMEWLVVEIGALTAEAIRVELVAGFAEGEGMEKIARRIRRVYRDCSTKRALTIARTEVIAASARGHLDGYKRSGVVKRVEWYTAADERTCSDCMALHGEVWTIEEAITPPAHPNCRCVHLPVID